MYIGMKAVAGMRKRRRRRRMSEKEEGEGGKEEEEEEEEESLLGGGRQSFNDPDTTLGHCACEHELTICNARCTLKPLDTLSGYGLGA